MNSSSRHSIASTTTDTESVSANEKEPVSFDETTEKHLNTNDTSHQPDSSTTTSSTSSPNSTTASASSTLSPPTPLPIPQNTIYNSSTALTPSSNKIRYYINNNTNTLNKTNTLTHNTKYKNDLSLMPSYNSGQQIFFDNSYMYRTYSYGPSYTPTPPHFYHQHQHHPIHYQQHQPPMTQLDLSSPVMRSQHHLQYQHKPQHQQQVQSQKKAPEYVSIRYFAPVEHVTSKLAKGETLNTDTLRSKLPVSSVQYVPNTGTTTLIGSSAYDDKRYFSTISSSNCYLKEGKINTATFKHFYEPSQNIVVNLESSQQQLLPNNTSTTTNTNMNGNSINNSSGSLKNESSSLNRSSLWNLTGGVTNGTNQRFYKEIKSENNLSKFYDRQGGSGGTLDKKSFSQKFGKTKKEKLKRNCKIFGTVFGVLAIVIIVASIVLCTALPNRSFSGARALFKEVITPISISNSTKNFNADSNQTNEIFLVEKTQSFLNQTILNSTNQTTEMIEFDENKLKTTTKSIIAEISSSIQTMETTTFIQNIQDKSSTETTTTTEATTTKEPTTTIIDITSSPIDPKSIITKEIAPLTIVIESTTIKENAKPETTTIENFFNIETSDKITSSVSTKPLILSETTKLTPQKLFLFKKH